ncbi:MAG: 7-carboxy-7-deazaguanine synthase QueE [Candidatus Azobacteroides sp.]|nr:7-carboxy-7-deazaguanine synthase QueE [Candidatus Azobacteroides sp.]
MNLKINEIFYSLQGEGGRQGEASIFIRLSGCNLECSFCDTDFSERKDVSADQILSAIKAFPCRWIVWTGGEPCLQLTDDIVLFFKRKTYLQAIESNGYYRLSSLLDYTVVSPKGNTAYARSINPQVNEVRLPIEKGDALPSLESLPAAAFYFLSPIFTPDPTTTQANIHYCVEQVKLHPQWRLSLQIHKWIGIE